VQAEAEGTIYHLNLTIGHVNYKLRRLADDSKKFFSTFMKYQY